MSMEMVKTHIGKSFLNVKKFAGENSPVLLLVAGVASFAVAEALTIKATVKAVRTVDVEKEIQGVDELPKKEVVKLVWKQYVPAAIAVTTATGCLVGGNRISAKQTAALSTAYKLSQNMFNDYRQKTADVIGEEKERQIVQKMASEKVNAPNADIQVTGKGDILCYDAQTGKLFTSDKNTIERAINNLNASIPDDMYVSFGDFCYEVGLHVGLIGDSIGWNVNSLPRHGLIQSSLHDSGVTDKGEPYLIVDFVQRPVSNYKDLY